METPKPKSRFAVVYALPFLVAFGLAVWMLMSDMNLQTDFGTQAKYYAHWYGVVAMAVVSLGAVVLLLALRSRTAVKLGVIGSGLLAVAMVGIIFSYSQVGFSSAGDFANYLFGVKYYGGDVRYLYDALLGTYVVTFLIGVVGLLATRPSRSPPPAPVSP